jgi:phage terminase small subunit
MSSLSLQDGAMPPANISVAAKAKWHPALHRREALNATAQEHLSRLALYCDAAGTWHDATRQNQAHTRLAGVGQSVFPSSRIGVSDGAVIQVAQLATIPGFSPDTPVTPRMPSFCDFARSAGTDASGDKDHGYGIVAADGTVEIA